MFQRKRRINELLSKLKNLSTLIDYKTRELGELIASLKDLSFESSQTIDIYDSILGIRKEIPEKKRIIQRINKIVESAEAVRLEVAKSRKGLMEVEKEASALHEKTGRMAYDIFKSHMKEYGKYEDVFVTIVRLDEKGEEYKRKDEPTARAERSAFSKIANLAKSLYSSQAYQANLTRYAKAYQGVGKRIVESDFWKEVQDRALDDVVSQATSLQKEIAEQGKKIEGLLSKKEKLTNELASLGVKGSSFLRIRELENERKKLDALLVTKHSSLGSLYIDNPHVLGNQNPEIANLLEEIKELGNESDRGKSEIRKIEAEIEIEAIREKIRKASGKVEQLEQSIRKSEEEIKSQKSRIAELEREKQKFEKIANGK